MARQRPGAHKQRGAVGPSEALRVWLLGGFRVSVGSRTIEEDRWRLKKAAGLVKLLALASEHRMHRERVTDLLWPDLEAPAAMNNLHRTLHSARRTLESRTPAADSNCLRLRGEQLELCLEGTLWVDAETFEEAAAAARRARNPAAYRAAIELYAGDLLPGDRYEPWAEDRREGLRQTYLALLLEMSVLHEAREDNEPAIEALERVVTEEPAHEGAHAGLMRLYALGGRRDEALKQYERLREEFSREFDSEPGTASQRFRKEILTGRFPPPGRPLAERPAEGADSIYRHNLPLAQSSFVGRERELVEVKRALAMARLLTLTGAGGCGKTRLALEVAKDLVGAYPDGVWLVELASLSDPARVPNAVAAALEVRERPDLPLTATLVDSIGSRRMLLVLDNCEHLIDAVAQLAGTLMRSCQHLRILATSRESLRVAGEVNWLVPSLAVPDANDSPAIQSLARYEAIQLFLERARARLPKFVLTPGNAHSVAKICRRLDGIPLAIELATARMAALALDQIAERLEDSLGFLTTGARTDEPRHQTLRHTLDWSHGLLDGPERALFRRLPVFAGGWTLEAAQEVCHDDDATTAQDDDVVELLARLVDKSLVVAEAAGADGSTLRYRMLEPIRQYARERLHEESAEETERLRERHAKHYLALAERAEPELMGADQIAWLERLAREYPNLWAALGWCLGDEGAKEPQKEEEWARMGLRLAVALGRFWSVRGANDGREWLEKGLAKSGTSPEALRARALREAGLIATYHLDPRAVAMLEEALALSKQLGDKTEQAISINYLAHTTGLLANLGRVATLRKEAETLLKEPLEDRRAAAHLHLTLGMLAILEEDYEQVVVRIEEALALFREVGDLRSCAQSLTIMGIGALGRGDVGRAARAFEETLGLLLRLKDRIGTFYSLMGVAGVAALLDRPVRAVRLAGAAEALRKAIGHPIQPLKQINYDYEGFLATTREPLGEAAFEAAFAEGQAMSPEGAIEYALTDDEPGPSTASVPEKPAPALLSPREREVALLAGQGLTNRLIAEELSISEHTVAAHVRRILKKLGLRSRAQIPPSPPGSDLPDRPRLP